MKQFYLILLLAFACATAFPALGQENNPTWGTVLQTDTIKQAGENKESVIEIKVFENRVLVENLQQEMILEIFNIMGVKVYSRRIPPGIRIISTYPPARVHPAIWRGLARGRYAFR